MVMKRYGVNELRQMFLDFFAGKGHLTHSSYSLVPHNDNSLLLINAGMAPLKPYFTGQEIPPCRRMATCQKCIRTGDIDNVGKTARHGTFFEMLGNFSFGDYFKREAITWSWEFLTEVIGLDKDRLYPSVYLDDDEAFDIWNKEIGVPADRIFRFGKEDNFWEHGAGPCGPCSEIYYDRGEKYGCGKPGCTVGCDCDRYMEVWNNVFTQFDGDGHGGYTELKNKNIDTGMGLERLAVVVQDVNSIFEVDTIRALLDRVCELSGKRYGISYDDDVSIRVITDHIRSCTFMASDGIMPSNEGRGYVFRRLLRRAARHGRKLGIRGLFLGELARTVIETSRDGYPELEEKSSLILNVLTSEEEKFGRTIDQGLQILAEMEERLASEDKKVLSGEDAFRLYDTFGFPIDLTIEMLDEKGWKVDEKGFDAAMARQKQTAREGRKETNYMGADATVYEQIDPSITSVFTGYDRLEDTGRIVAITTDTELVQALSEGDRGTIVTDRTPFYATMGGQQADVGTITTAEGGEFKVEDTIALKGGKVGHVGVVTAGMFSMSQDVKLHVDESRRQATARNHSATHLLQKALRQVLGDHVEQAGSMNNSERLRFDFTHFSAMTPEQLHRVEELVNEDIRAGHDVQTQVMSLEDARKSGAMALFGEKYHDDVRVVTMGDSKELCGGTHVKNVSDIQAFKILSESGIAAGVRRIEALTGDNLMHYYRQIESQLQEVAQILKAQPAQVKEKTEALLTEMKLLRSENESLKNRLASESVGDVGDNTQDVKGVKLVTIRLSGVEMNEMRNLGDSIRDKTPCSVIVLASDAGGKASLMVCADDAAQKKGAHAGNIVKAIARLVGGGGGGRANMAQAGGSDPSGIDKALAAARDALAGQIG